jgi:aryl-alcohol dehydrogenase-like predicted oxidoreductase
MRNLGNSGLRVSETGLGCNNFGGRLDFESTRRVVDKALDLGITLFDTADIYGNKGGSEEHLGQILGDRRKKIVLATKFGMPMEAPEKTGASRRYIMSEVEDSLRRLRTDWIDLYQIHQPDGLTPIEETLRALDDLIHQGKVRYIGCSNFPAWQVIEAQWTSHHLGLNHFISCQDEYSLLVRGIDRDLMPVIERHHLGLLPYFPLANGLLTGKYSRDHLPEGARLSNTKTLADRYLTESNWQKVERLRQFCADHGRTMVELAFSWLLMRPGVASVIAGATKPEQLEQNIAATNWPLTPDELAQIDQITKP